jgi:hypothetical protein
MADKSTLRFKSRPPTKVHIIPLGLDYDRIVQGIQYYGADRIYIIRGRKENPIEDEVQFYFDKLKRQYDDVASNGDFREIRVDIFDIGEISRAIYEVIGEEKENQLFFCLSSSTKLVCSYMLFAVWSRGHLASSPPVIYYVDPKRYLHTDFTRLSAAAQELLPNLDRLVKEETLDEVRQFIKNVRNLSYEARDGMTQGRAAQRFLYEVPYVHVKAPNQIELDILRLLSENGGKFDTVDSLAKSYFRRVEGVNERQQITDSEMNKMRGRLSFHIEALVRLKMIEKERNGRKVNLLITELGHVFAGK